MNTLELEQAIRNSSFIGDAAAFTEFTQNRILLEANDKLQTVFEDIVVKARAGYWAHEFIYTVAANDSRYRIPPRAVVQGLEKIECASALTGPWIPLEQVPIAIASYYKASTQGTPYIFSVFGDIVDVMPTPAVGTFLKMTYYIRPSRMCPTQALAINGAGLISAVNVGARTVTIANNVPLNYANDGTSAAITSGSTPIDIIHPDGWHELSMVSAPQTLSGAVFTLGGTDDMGDILVGDYVRAAGQTDWPCLPDDFHRCLADAVAVKVLLEQGLSDKANDLANNNGNDLTRFRSLLLPRVKSQPKSIGVMQRSRGYVYPGWRLP